MVVAGAAYREAVKTVRPIGWGFVRFARWLKLGHVLVNALRLLLVQTGKHLLRPTVTAL